MSSTVSAGSPSSTATVSSASSARGTSPRHRPTRGPVSSWSPSPRTDRLPRGAVSPRARRGRGRHRPPRRDAARAASDRRPARRRGSPRRRGRGSPRPRPAEGRVVPPPHVGRRGPDEVDSVAPRRPGGPTVAGAQPPGTTRAGPRSADGVPVRWAYLGEVGRQSRQPERRPQRAGHDELGSTGTCTANVYQLRRGCSERVIERASALGCGVESTVRESTRSAWCVPEVPATAPPLSCPTTCALSTPAASMTARTSCASVPTRYAETSDGLAPGE